MLTTIMIHVTKRNGNDEVIVDDFSWLEKRRICPGCFSSIISSLPVFIASSLFSPLKREVIDSTGVTVTGKEEEGRRKQHAKAYILHRCHHLLQEDMENEEREREKKACDFASVMKQEDEDGRPGREGKRVIYA